MFLCNLFFNDVLCKKVIVVDEVIGIIIILVKVLAPIVTDGAVLEEEVAVEALVITEVVVVFVVSYLSEKVMIVKYKFIFSRYRWW